MKISKTVEAFENIRHRRWTLWKAAEYCETSLWAFFDHLRQENIPYPLSVKELEIELNENQNQQ